jgi:hypothetical protein
LDVRPYDDVILRRGTDAHATKDQVSAAGSFCKMVGIPREQIETDYGDTITRHEYEHEHAYEYDARRYDYESQCEVSL